MRNGGEIIADDVVRIERDGNTAKSLVLKSGQTITLDKLVICGGRLFPSACQATRRKGSARGGARLPHGSAEFRRQAFAFAHLCATRPGRQRPWTWDCGWRAPMNLRASTRRTELGPGRCPVESLQEDSARAQRTRFRHDALDGAQARHAGFAAGHWPLKDGFKCLVWLWPQPHGADLGAFDRPPDQRAHDRCSRAISILRHSALTGFRQDDRNRSSPLLEIRGILDRTAAAQPHACCGIGHF